MSLLVVFYLGGWVGYSSGVCQGCPNKKKSRVKDNTICRASSIVDGAVWPAIYFKK